MTWTPGDSHFRMVLSKKVGLKIRDVLRDHVSRFLDSHGLRIQDIDRFAVHPGGHLIIETVQKSLGLDEEAVRHSKAILHQYGNMSSSTLPHIWASMQADSAGSLSVAERHAPAGASVMYRPADAYTLPFPAASFDAVLMMDFLEHVDEPGRAMAEASRVLKAQGLLIFYTFNRTLLSKFLAIDAVELIPVIAPSIFTSGIFSSSPRNSKRWPHGSGSV
jgi:SAM-dependent methyltransferase